MKNIYINWPGHKDDKDHITYEQFTFSGGEPHVKISYLNTTPEVISEGKYHVDKFRINIRINSFEDIGKLKVLVDAMRRKGAEYIEFFIPYFPGARQDRVMVEGEPLTSAVYVKEIVSLKPNKVITYDIHSDVVGGMFGVLDVPFRNITNHGFIRWVRSEIIDERLRTPRIVSPDAGSNKKIKDLMKCFPNDEQPIKCDKTRDVKTGEIIGFEVYADDLQGEDCLVVDDICDGGGTFMGLAKELKTKNAGNIYLAVSHGIFSKGIDVLTNNGIDGLFTTDSIGKYVNFINVYQLNGK